MYTIIEPLQLYSSMYLYLSNARDDDAKDVKRRDNINHNYLYMHMTSLSITFGSIILSTDTVWRKILMVEIFDESGLGKL